MLPSLEQEMASLRYINSVYYLFISDKTVDEVKKTINDLLAIKVVWF